ncbi:MAG: S9 family peptidase [Prevotella sp.]|nr:S9 family peptidase [Prevotella sp.]
MKKTILICAFLFIAVSTSLAAQQLRLKDITDGTFRAEAMAAVEALVDGESYAQISDDGKRILKFSFRNGQQTGVLFDAATARGANVRRVDGYLMSPDGRRMLIQTQTERIYRHSFTSTYYIYTIANNKLEPLSDGGPQQAPLWSPDGNVVAFVRDNNIFLVKLLYNNAESQVTKDGERGKVLNGIPDWVNEEEFATSQSMAFTADSQQLVWIRYDESQVKEYSITMFQGMMPCHEEYAAYPGSFCYKYPKAGQQNSTVSVKSFDIKSRQTRTLQVPLDVDGYIPRLKSTSDPTKVAVFTLNRHQDNLRLYLANPMSTVCQLALDDKVDKYINEDSYSDAQISAAHIVLTSEHSGKNSIYVYSLGGQLQRTVTQGVVTSFYGYDEATGDVFFAACPDGAATEQKVYVSHRNGRTDCLTPAGGWHSAIFSNDYKNYLLTRSDLNTPPVTTLCSSAGGKQVKALVDNKGLASTYASYDMGRKELFSFTTSEGVQLNGWMVKPAGFDPSKHYPVIMYQYGGPGSQQVKNAWGIGMNGQGAILEQYLSQQGYIVACVDGRGTGGRGAEFEKCVYLQLGLLEARDQVEAALWLGHQTYVDKDRIAIWGWSYGGFNTLMSMSEGRGVFCCGIAIAPPTDWRFYDTVYTERYMRTPQENSKGYDDNPIRRASQLHGALLMCHGLADDNVHYQNTAEYAEALVQADKDFSQLVYTNRNHSIYGGNTRHHLFRQCVNFFNANMKK